MKQLAKEQHYYRCKKLQVKDIYVARVRERWEKSYLIMCLPLFVFRLLLWLKVATKEHTNKFCIYPRRETDTFRFEQGKIDSPT